jgi:hypothetical protein
VLQFLLRTSSVTACIPRQLAVNVRRLIIALGVACVAIGAQTPSAPTFEIRGKVLEASSGQPIAGATVTLAYFGADQPAFMPSPPKSELTTTSDASGHFLFRPSVIGYYLATAAKVGHRTTPGPTGVHSSSREAVITEANAVREVALYLTLPGFFEMDMVAHCGRSVAGSHAHSLVLTDIATGWTEAAALVITEDISSIRCGCHLFPNKSIPPDAHRAIKDGIGKADASYTRTDG